MVTSVSLAESLSPHAAATLFSRDEPREDGWPWQLSDREHGVLGCRRRAGQDMSGASSSYTCKFAPFGPFTILPPVTTGTHHWFCVSVSSFGFGGGGEGATSEGDPRVSCSDFLHLA